MDKTLQNISHNKNVALVCWSKMMGYQIKGEVEIFTAGENFEEAVTWVSKIYLTESSEGYWFCIRKKFLIFLPPKNKRSIYPRSKVELFLIFNRTENLKIFVTRYFKYRPRTLVHSC